MIFDGKAFAEKRRGELLEARKMLGDISLAVVMGEHDPVTSSFVRVKERTAKALDVSLVRYLIPSGGTTQQVRDIVHEARKENGIIVQLPLAPNVDTEAVLADIPAEKDVDALSPATRERLAAGDLSVMPPVAAAIHSILQNTKHPMSEIAGKRVVVVGKGRLVGMPCAVLFEHLGAQVLMLGKEDDVTLHTQRADVIVLGAGSPHFLKPAMVKEGVIIFDAGTSESNGVVVGDASPACAEKASFFTPTPGGIGPVAVVEIFGNVMTLTKRARGHKQT